jgi:hypothetical protein
MKEPFLPTIWAEVIRTRTEHPGRRREAVNVVAQRYWKPVYSFLLWKYKDVHKAEDLTQGFFTEIVMGHDLLQGADPTRGKLRNLLLTALGHYVGGEYRRDTARSRQPPGGFVSLEGLEDRRLPEPVAGATADQAYLFTWASSLIAETTREVKEECLREGQGLHWELFYATVLLPIVEGAEPPSNAELRAKHGLATDQDVSNRSETVRRKYRRVLRAKVRGPNESQEDVDSEIAELMRICAEFRASS